MSTKGSQTNWQDPDVIRKVATSARTVAIVGISPDPTRPSHHVASYLQESGLRIVPINPAISSFLGLTVYPSLADLTEPVDIVDVFRRPEYTEEIAEQAVAIGAQTLWLQLGIINPVAARIAANAGLNVVMDRCLAVEHRRLSTTR